ncbi:MAG: DUF441 domain-containing protein [Thermoanaerobacteraceae bacterium]|nr:DUF441 domain-containing protein [Thermoanaerobacteraceae bacterium]
MKSYSLIFLIFVLGLLSKNRLIYISAGVLLAFSMLKLMPTSPSAQKVILDVGVILLVIGVMIPFSQGFIFVHDLYKSLFATSGCISFIIGILSSVMAKDGVELMKNSPEVMIGLLFGTIIGTAFFGGIPVGPLVAAGLAAFIINFFAKIT